jgi:hypothetical protein
MACICISELVCMACVNNENNAGAGTAATWGARTLQGIQRVKANALAMLVMLLYSPYIRP